MILTLAGLAWAQSAALDAAYQKEFAYLLAERAELQERLAEFEGDATRRTTAANAALDELQGRLVAVTREADQADDALDAIERSTTSMADADALLESTLRNATETLALTPTGDMAQDVDLVFQGVEARLREGGQAHASDGAFFLPDGQEVHGRIWRWGLVAAWGVSDQGAGSLAPAGEGRLQLRRDFGASTADRWATATPQPTVEVHLFEAERGAEEAEKGGGLGQLLTDAGTMGQVLFGLGCVSATLVLIRALTLLWARRGGQPLVERVTTLVRQGELDGARRLVHGVRNPTARLLDAILEASARPAEELDRVVDATLLREIPRIDRFASALVVITAGSPLLGLLGTVTGMIATFDVITEHGTGNPKLMSAGIAEALICTALGLTVAIPTLLAGNVLASAGSTIKNVLERGALGLRNALEDLQRSRMSQHRGGGTHAHGVLGPPPHPSSPARLPGVGAMS